MKPLCLKMVLVIFFVCSAVMGDDSVRLREEFQNPPKSAKPHTWWHWMNGNISKQGITADLESMAKVGIGGVQVFNIADKGSVNIPKGPVKMFTPEWYDLMVHAVKEADRLGLEMCLHNCPGWSCSGGPWITPEYAMQHVVSSDTKVEGPKLFVAKLEQPLTREGYYKDIGVFAFPKLADDKFRIKLLKYKAAYYRDWGRLIDTAEIPAGAIIAKKDIIDLSNKMDDTGKITWNVPQGKWTIVRIGHTPSGKTNHPAPEEGIGLECDKLSKEALDLHWNEGIKPLLDKLGPLVGKTLNNILIDSYEVGGNNWTAKFRDEFRKKRGYDLWDYMPILAGRVVGSNLITEKFMWDFRLTINDMFIENYYNYFAEKCDEIGVLTSVEPYPGPFECLSVAQNADIVMAEFWVGGSPMDSTTKLAASVAHTHGQKYVGSESFSSYKNGRWQNHPATLKALGDRVWCEGVNRFIFHRFAHQPWDDKWQPGMTMGMWGTFLDRKNTWWNLTMPWMKYIARSQYLLQNGQFQADVLHYNGPALSNFHVYDAELKDLGYDYDAMGTDLIDKLSVVNGKICLPSGMQYKLLTLKDSEYMTVGTITKIQQLIKDGAVIISDKPKMSPSLSGYPGNDAVVKKIADEIWGKNNSISTLDKKYGKGRIFVGKKPQEVLEIISVEPDFKTLAKEPEITFIHRSYDSSDIYFVSSSKKYKQTVECSFRMTGKLPQLWNPLTGEITQVPIYKHQDNRTIVTITFDPEDSVFVVFVMPAKKPADHYVSLESGTKAVFEPIQPADKLEIIKAEYGVLKLPGMVDITEKLTKLIKNNKLKVRINNELVSDPAYGMRKSLFVEYKYDGQKKIIQIDETHLLDLPAKSDTPAGGKLEITKATYGGLPMNITRLPRTTFVDVTKEIAKKIKKASLNIKVDANLIKTDPAPGFDKILRIKYRYNGIESKISAAHNETIQLPVRTWQPVPFTASLQTDNSSTKLQAWQKGKYNLKKANGKNVTVTVKSLPEIFELKGPWTLNFPKGWNAPDQIEFTDLISWTNHTNEGIKYFSGTATYKKQFTLGDDFDKNTGPIVLDLGRVMWLAKIKLNGKDLGIVWKNPFRVDISNAVKKGVNDLEVEITNLWPNRLIGDEQYPEDRNWNNYILAEWPEWFLKGQPRPSKNRLTFTTWKWWFKDDPLTPSGLLGPVTIRQAKILSLKNN